MVRDPFESEDAPDLQSVLTAFDDTDRRTIIRNLDGRDGATLRHAPTKREGLLIIPRIVRDADEDTASVGSQARPTAQR